MTMQGELQAFIQSKGLSLDDMRRELFELTSKDLSKRLEASTTNSPVGCQLWYNTLLGQIARDAEYIHDYPDKPRDLHEKRLQGIAANARILIDNYNKIPYNY